MSISKDYNINRRPKYVLTYWWKLWTNQEQDQGSQKVMKMTEKLHLIPSVKVSKYPLSLTLQNWAHIQNKSFAMKLHSRKLAPTTSIYLNCFNLKVSYEIKKKVKLKIMGKLKFF